MAIKVKVKTNRRSLLLEAIKGPKPQSAKIGQAYAKQKTRTKQPKQPSPPISKGPAPKVAKKEPSMTAAAPEKAPEKEGFGKTEAGKTISALATLFDKIPVAGNVSQGVQALVHFANGAIGDKQEFLLGIAYGIKAIPQPVGAGMGFNPEHLGQFVQDFATGAGEAMEKSKEYLEILDKADDTGGILDEIFTSFKKYGAAWVAADKIVTNREGGKAELKAFQEDPANQPALKALRNQGGVRQYLPKWLQQRLSEGIEDEETKFILLEAEREPEMQALGKDETGAAKVGAQIEKGAEKAKDVKSVVGALSHLIGKVYDSTPSGKMRKMLAAADLEPDLLTPEFIEKVRKNRERFPTFTKVFMNLESHVAGARAKFEEFVSGIAEKLGVKRFDSEQKATAESFFNKNTQAAEMCKVLGGCETIEEPKESASIKEVYATRNNLLYERLKREYTY